MDSPYDRGETYRAKFHRNKAIGPWTGFQADLYLSQVEHLMDNYSLRPRTTPMAMRVPTTSDTFGGRASGQIGLGEQLQLTLGIDYQRNERQALRFAGPSAQQVTLLQAVMWPDAELAQTGLFVEGDRSLGKGSRVRFGLRLDSFEASADKSDLAPAGTNLSPNQLYQLYYGSTAQPWSDTGVSALLRYERSLRAGWTLFTGASRSLSAPDATARYLGAGNPTASRRWVGNPGLEVAAHHQVDLGIAAATQSRRWSTTAFLDLVDNFVLRDRAGGQPGILLADRASIYRNVDARLVGLELDASWAPSSALSLRGNASWVRGDNRTDGRPLAQIPPLQGVAAVDYSKSSWRGTAALRWALEQSRGEDDPRAGNGLDFGPTPGHTVLDLQGALPLRGGFEILAGIDNVLDETYAEHLNRGNLFDPDPVRVNEPGRAVWVRLRWLGNGD
jgi:iron complex outermembrane receptor protein